MINRVDLSGREAPSQIWLINAIDRMECLRHATGRKIDPIDRIARASA